MTLKEAKKLEHKAQALVWQLFIRDLAAQGWGTWHPQPGCIALWLKHRQEAVSYDT